MVDTLSASAQRVQDVLNAFEVECQVVELPDSTRSAQEAAQAVGCQVEQIVKSLIFKGKQSHTPVHIPAGWSGRHYRGRPLHHPYWGQARH